MFTSGCPSDIAIDDATEISVRVHWQRPTVTDNSGVQPMVTSTKQSGQIFDVPGSYVVQYVAEDQSGNRATCSFRITLKRKYRASSFQASRWYAHMTWVFINTCHENCCSKKLYFNTSSYPAKYSPQLRSFDFNYVFRSRKTCWLGALFRARRIPGLPLNKILYIASSISLGDYALNFINTHENGLLLGSVLITEATIMNVIK